jgi:hypothetical protein
VPFYTASRFGQRHEARREIVGVLTAPAHRRQGYDTMLVVATVDITRALSLTPPCRVLCITPEMERLCQRLPTTTLETLEIIRAY